MNIGFSFACFILIGLIIMDKSKNRNYKPYLVGIGGFVIRQISIYLASYNVV